MLKIFAALFLMIISTPVFANPVVENYIPNAQKVGEGRLTYLVWDVYDATLFAPNGTWNNDKPFALKLSYLRDISGQDIADTSAQKIRKQGFSDEIKLATWHAQMRDIFTDVKGGTEIIGVQTQNGDTKFYRDGQNIGAINDSDFGDVFFKIWLGENTSIPSLRKKLLGQSG